uniref:Uncharacterized protein n=1 Tax=Timema poppense TaxID=170557 RepID=A0A7R9GTF7_TIMPO|nr:unnamed protein product [Timema poppensis]
MAFNIQMTWRNSHRGQPGRVLLSTRTDHIRRLCGDSFQGDEERSILELIYQHSRGRRVGNQLGTPNLSRPDRDLNPDLLRHQQVRVSSGHLLKRPIISACDL